jgi:fumarylacetoacetase
MRSWIPVPPNSDFPLANIPFGIFSTVDNPQPRVATIIGDTVIDLYELQSRGCFMSLELAHNGGSFEFELFNNSSLNYFIAKGKPFTNGIRKALQNIFAEGATDTPIYKVSDLAKALHPVADVTLHLPIQIGDYTDFYSSRQHATNVGMMFRDPANALLPNWLHLPVGYHGRASSIVVSGTDVVRPMGQRLPPNATVPVFGASQLLDFELEMAFVVGKNTAMGQRITTAEAEDYIFGCALFNDWSARDIQAWEYVPLGPFLAKNFASSLAPWIVTLEALDEFRMAGPDQTDPQILSYLQYEGNRHYDIALEVAIQPANGAEKTVCRSNFKYLYWNMVQQLAHHTVGGCNMRVGDLLASGTISGDKEGSFGSMLEITWRGTKPVVMPDGTERKFINDDDTVIMRGFGEKNGTRIGFGEVTGKIIAANSEQ